MTESLRILILEDNPSDAELTRFELEEAGLIFTSKVVMTEEDFVREIQEYCPDLILSDYDLPKYTGALALAEARRRCPDTPFILVTGAVTEDRAIDILTQGAKDYVLKNRLQQRLVPAARRALAEAEEHRARKQAEAELREAHRTLENQVQERTSELEESRERLSLALTSSGMGAFEWDLVHNKRFFDDYVYSLLGIKPDDFSGKAEEFFHAVHPDDRHAVQDAQKKAIEQYAPYETEYRAIWPDGSVHHIAARGKVLRESTGRPVRMIGVCWEISERKQAEEKMRCYELLAEHARDIVLFIRRDDGRIMEANAAAVSAYGYTHEELLVLTIHDLRASNTRELTPAQMAEAERNGILFETCHRCKDGMTFPVEVSSRGATIGGVRMLISVIRNITERKQAEEKLAESESRYRALFDSAGYSIGIAKNGVQILVNPAFVKLFGHKDTSELVGINLTDAIAPEERERVKKYVNGRALGMEVPTRYETKGLRKDGSIFDMEVMISSYVIDSELYTVGFHSDITKRKQMEEALRESEEKHRRLFENMSQGVVYYTANGDIIAANLAAERILGLSLDQMLGKTCLSPDWKLVREDGSELPDQEHPLMVALRTGKPVDRFIMGVLNPRKGVLQWLSITEIPLFHPGETKPFQVYSTFEDVTERKRVEMELREREEKYWNLFNNAEVGMFRTRLDGSEMIEMNDKFLQIFSRTREEMQGNPSTIHWADLQEREEMLRRIRTEGRISELECRMLNRLGEVRDCLTSLRAYPERGILEGSIIDITERKRLEKERENLSGRLMRAEKMEAIGTLAGGIAHDFNNILAAITGYTEMALDENPNEIQQQYLQNTLKGAERAKNLVRQILSFSRHDSHEKQTLDMKPLLKEAVKFLRASIPATIEIQQSLTDESCSVMADPTQMNQIIMNLCTNATHAMKKNGDILKIGLSSIELAKGELPRYPDLEPGPYVKMNVSDTGYGIDPAYIDRIFDPFFTTKTKDEGTGLGLSVVYGIVRSHGGIVNVDSEPEKGASFDVYLPRIIHEGVITESISRTATGGTERILFVDDERPIVDFGMRMLFSLGYEVTGITSSEEALGVFRAEPENFDLVITDMTLPKMTGIDLSREILKIHPDIPIILCSGIRESDTEEQVKSLGIRAYCMKPLTKGELARVIRDTLDAHKDPLP